MSIIVERFGNQVRVSFPTEVQAADFERNLRKVLGEKRRERVEVEKRFSKEINQFKREERGMMWNRRRIEK